MQDLVRTASKSPQMQEQQKKPADTRFEYHGCSALLYQPLEKGNCFEEWHKCLQKAENLESA